MLRTKSRTVFPLYNTRSKCAAAIQLEIVVRSFARAGDCNSGKTKPLRASRRGFYHLVNDRSVGQASSVQLALRDRRLELRDLGGLRRLAVERQHVAFRRDRD